jgi:hypothetical protein
MKRAVEPTDDLNGEQPNKMKKPETTIKRTKREKRIGSTRTIH